MAKTTLLDAVAMVFLISLSTRIIHSECCFSDVIIGRSERRKLTNDFGGYSYPVYKTNSCPENQKEWNKRSYILNCTEYNGYMCLPNENRTELLEFCYTKPMQTIPKGTCLYLDKRSSMVNDFNCKTFLHGCPEANYQSVDLYKYPSCTSIGNGCFLAESSCNRSLQTIPHSKRLTTSTMVQNGEAIFKKTVEEEETPSLLSFIFPSCALVLLFSAFMFFYCRMKYWHTDNKYSDNIPILPDEEADNYDDDDDKEEDEGTSKKSLSKSHLDGNVVKSNLWCLSNACFNITEKQSPNYGATVKDIEKNLSPLQLSCLRGDINSVKLLLQETDDVNVRSKGGDSSLHIACEKGNAEIVKLLLSRGADANLLNSNGISPLYLANNKKQTDIVKIIHQFKK